MSRLSIPTSIESTIGPVPLVTKTPDIRPAVSTTNVLHLVNGEHFSGAERVQSHLGRCLPDSGFAADFACVKPGKFAELMEEQSGHWGNCHRLPMSGRWDVRVAWGVRDLVQQHGYRLLHAHTPRTAMLAAIASRLAGIPWVYHVHSPASRDSTRGWVNRINATMERYALRSADHLITVSQSLREDCLRGGTSANKITTVHNGVPSIRPPRELFPTVGGTWTLGMVALMRPRKGLEVALHSLAKLRGEGFDLKLRCIGPFETEEYRKSILDLVLKLGLSADVQWEGFTDDVPSALVQLDAMLLPSLFGEGLPMVVLEAMAAAVPVIATRVEGTPEAITDGVEGLLAAPSDPESLADKIRCLLVGRSNWNRMSEAACQRHGAEFSDRAMARGVAGVYETVLRSGDADHGHG